MRCAIRLSLKEIKYEVKFDTWLRSKVFNETLRSGNEKAGKVGLAYDNDKAEDWLVRQVEGAVDDLRGALRWCLDEPMAGGLTDDINERPEEWLLEFKFGQTWRGSARALRTYVHRYVVETVLYKWYTAVNIDGAKIHGAEASAALDGARDEARSETVEPFPWNL